jgi:hypothetical protein
MATNGTIRKKNNSSLNLSHNGPVFQLMSICEMEDINFQGGSPQECICYKENWLMACKKKPSELRHVPGILPNPQASE